MNGQILDGLTRKLKNYYTEAEELIEHTQQGSIEEQVFKTQMYNCKYALRRINENSYGCCNVCRKPILLERLMELPWVKRCIECSSLSS